MLWEVDISPKGEDQELARIRAEFALLSGRDGSDALTASRKGYLLEGIIHQQAKCLVEELLVDSLVETAVLRELTGKAVADTNGDVVWTVLLKPGVMDPVAQSVLDAARDLDVPLPRVRTFRRYLLSARAAADPQTCKYLRKVLANDAIEQIEEGRLHLDNLKLGREYVFRGNTVPLRDLDERGLERVSREGQLALNLDEMKTIRGYFRDLGRDPTDVELETVAQTWSEHCSHKTLKGKIDFGGRHYDNLLKETIFGATQEIRRRLGADDWCVSVFEDNAGIVKFNDDYNVCFKVETHNHPSAIEPYGGANTGIGGVIRDPLGTGLGAKPICNTDVFCFAPPEVETGEELPPGVLHPARVMTGVVAGVRDYGNRMGIPTVNGAVYFDKRYLGNPLVYCGTVGLIPVDACRKEAKAGDLIVAVGGRTGRDGIHGATFSSIELTSESEEISGGAVQIGNPITEKKLIDVIVQARDRKLYHAITDCGAGGFSSAVGEMGAKIGAIVHLEKAPLKYQGLSYTEIWISEAQERMVLAVPPENWDELKQLCLSESVEATVIGDFEATGRLRLFYQGEQVGDLAMEFLHEGRPEVVRRATWNSEVSESRVVGGSPCANPQAALFAILSTCNVASKEWIVRQYDHEVQGGTVIKPLVGAAEDGPGDAAVIAPILGEWMGLAVGCGLCPQFGDLDPYRMAALAIDEAVRNVVAVGADPARIALLDNFCWGNTDRPKVLGSLVLAAEACRDVALAFNMPFISGKDSLKNEFHWGDSHIVIPPTLLISALGRVRDVRQCVTMDLKEAGNELYLIGETKNEMGGSHYHLIQGISGGDVPGVDLELAPGIFSRLHEAIRRGLVRSCHDLSEGGLAVAAAEMAFAGNVGAEIQLPQSSPTRTPVADTPDSQAAVALFSESATRFLVEISPDNADEFKKTLGDAALGRLGITTDETRLRVVDQEERLLIDASLSELKNAWQKPLRSFAAARP